MSTKPALQKETKTTKGIFHLRPSLFPSLPSVKFFFTLSMLFTVISSARAAITVTGDYTPAEPFWSNGGNSETGGTIGNSGTGTLLVNGGLLSNSNASLGLLNTANGSATVTSGTWAISGNSLSVGVFGTGSLLVNGGLVSNPFGTLGAFATGHGSVTVTSGTWANSELLSVGSSGTGNLLINGGLVSNPDSRIGSNNGTGSATVTSGTWASSGVLYVGYSSTGSLLINGGRVSDTVGVIGNQATGKGSVTVTSGTWAHFDSLFVGESGTGSLLINGGLVSNTSGLVGSLATGNGSVTVTSGTWANSSGLSVGYSGSGSLLINGGRVSNNVGYIGDNATGVGSVTVTSGTWANSNILYVGNSGTGNLLVNGGLVSNTSGRIGQESGSKGSVTVTSGTWVNTAGLFVGLSGTGSLLINGGLVNVSTNTVVIGSAASSVGSITVSGNAAQRGVLATQLIGEGSGSGTVTLNGGILRATASQSNFLSGFETGDVTLGANGGFIDTNGHAVGIATSLVGPGALNKQGAGTLTLTGANANSGGAVIHSGTLQIGNGGTAGSVTGNIVDNAHLVFNRSDNLTYGGIISGTGNLTKLGSGILTLTNASTYTGQTFINAGTLSIMGSLETGGLVTIGSGAAFAGTGVVNRDVLINTGGTLSSSLTVNGQITLPGSQQQNVGNVSSGTATASSGQQLIVDNATGGTVNAANGTATITTLNGATLETGNWGATVTTLTSGTVNTSGGALVAQQGNFTGAITGNGGLVKAGSGTLTLQAANSYTGGTAINAGTLVVANGGSTGGSAVEIAGAGRLVAESGAQIAGGVVSTSTEAVYEKTFAGSESLANLGAFSSDISGRDTATFIAAGTAGAGGANVTAQYTASGNFGGSLISDRISLHGLDSTTFLMVMSVTMPGGVDDEDIYLAWLDSNPLSPTYNTWVNAVEGNYGAAGSLAGFYAETSYLTFLDDHGGWNPATMLGAYGMDRGTGTVWAVIDHNSDFGAVPEPGTCALLGLGLSALLLTRRRKRAA